MGEPRGRYQAGRVREGEIAAAAAVRFAEFGYDGTSIARIARDVGITKEGVLHYFPSKAHLLLEVTRRKMQRINRWWADLPESPSVIDILGRMYRSERMFVEEPEVVELSTLAAIETARLLKGSTDPDLATHPRIVAGIASQFEGCQARGDCRADLSAESIARQMIAMSDGLHLQWIICERSFDLAEVALEHFAMVAQACIPPDRLPADVRQSIVRAAS